MSSSRPGPVGVQPSRLRVGSLDAVKLWAKKQPTTPKCLSASSGSIETTGSPSASPSAWAIARVVTACSATACRRVPGSALSMPSRISRAVSER